MSGQFVIRGKGLSVFTGTSDKSGSFTVANQDGYCEECCRDECSLYFCGGAPLRADRMSYPRKLGRPAFFKEYGFCREHENSAHCSAFNYSACDVDQFTTFKFNCNGDKTASLVTKQYVYTGNNEQVGVKTQWRFADYSTSQYLASGFRNAEDAWPWLECFPEYNETTSVLTVEIKWSDLLYNDNFTLLLEFEGSGNEELPLVNCQFVSWSGPGTASGSANEITIENAGQGVATGTATFNVSGPDLFRIKATVDDDQISLTGVIEKDYPHTLLGTDSATINFGSTGGTERCGWCVGEQEVEIDFDCGQGEYTVRIANWITLPYEENNTTKLMTHWCGCGSIPYNDDAINTYSGQGDEGAFHVGIGRIRNIGRKDSCTILGNDWGGGFGRRPQAVRLNSTRGGEYGWSMSPGLISRPVPTEIDSAGYHLEKRKDETYGVAGFSIAPLQEHAAEHYPYERFDTPVEYNENRRLGYVKRLTQFAGNDPHKFPELKYATLPSSNGLLAGNLYSNLPDAGGTPFALKVETSFDVTFHYHGWDQFCHLRPILASYGNYLRGIGIWGYSFWLKDLFGTDDGVQCWAVSDKQAYTGFNEYREGTPKIAFGIRGWTAGTLPMYYTIKDVETSINVKMSCYWDAYDQRFVRSHQIDGEEFVVDGTPEFHSPEWFYEYHFMTQRFIRDEDIGLFYCRGSSIIIEDKSWRRGYDFSLYNGPGENFGAGGGGGSDQGGPDNSGVPFQPGKRNFTVQNLTQTWTEI